MAEVSQAKRESFPDRAQYYILLLIISFLPFSQKIIPPLIFLWTVLWLVSGNLVEKIKSAFRNVITVLMILFFLVHLAGMLYTSNLSAGWFDLEVKFSLLLIPVLIFSSASLWKERVGALLLCFVAANFIASVICFVHIFYKSFSESVPFYNLLYEDFSLFLHPTYGAMFTLFSISVLVYYLTEGRNIFNSSKISIKPVLVITYSLILFFCITVYFYSSRAGLISFAVVFVLAVFFFLIRSDMNRYFKFFVVVLSAAGLFILVNSNPRFQFFLRFLQSHQKLNYQSMENAEVRYIIILETMDLIKENMPLGVGTGDIKSSLMKRYTEKNFTAGNEFKLNAHNQFLETLLGQGIAGGLLLLVLILVPLISGIRASDFLLLSFASIIGVNFLFESMLNLQSGVVFYSLFNSLLWLNHKKIE